MSKKITRKWYAKKHQHSQHMGTKKNRPARNGSGTHATELLVSGYSQVATQNDNAPSGARNSDLATQTEFQLPPGVVITPGTMSATNANVDPVGKSTRAPLRKPKVSPSTPKPVQMDLIFPPAQPTHPPYNGLATCVGCIPPWETITPYGTSKLFALEFETSVPWTGGKLYRVAAKFSPTLHKKSSFHGFLRNWLGRPLLPSDIPLEIAGLIGRQAEIEVSQRLGKDGKTYADIVTIRPLTGPNGMTGTPPPLVTPPQPPLK